MKRTATDHPKLANLADAIAAEHKHQRRFAILIATGILERLWHFTAKFTPQGDIGKRRDEEICRWVGWPIDESSTLIRLLIQTEWLVNHPVHRLIVHDWQEHSDDSVKKLLQRKGLTFACLDMSGLVPPSSLPEARSQKPEPINVHGERAPVHGGGKALTLCPDCGEPQSADDHPDGCGAALEEFRRLSVEPPTLSREDPRAAWFDEFWAVYGKIRNANKAKAKVSFMRIVTTESKFTTIMERLRIQEPGYLRREKDKRPHATTWLNGARWEDEPDGAAANGHGRLESAFDLFMSQREMEAE